MEDIFEQPPNESIKIWRYLDFTKFISLIDSSRLFFASANTFEDPFEGSWTSKDIVTRDDALDNLVRTGLYTAEAAKQMKLLFKFLPLRVGLSCWHENEYESAAMWKLYLKSNEGVAIQTTYELLKKSFKDGSKLHFGRIRYSDFTNGQLSEEDVLSKPLLWAFANKRKSFEHEREIRALYMADLPDIRTMDQGIGAGVTFEVDLTILIQKIYIYPQLDRIGY